MENTAAPRHLLLEAPEGCASLGHLVLSPPLAHHPLREQPASLLLKAPSQPCSECCILAVIPELPLLWLFWPRQIQPGWGLLGPSCTGCQATRLSLGGQLRPTLHFEPQWLQRPVTARHSASGSGCRQYPRLLPGKGLLQRCLKEGRAGDFCYEPACPLRSFIQWNSCQRGPVRNHGVRRRG